jgi:isoleucyl-tRNA synthetase
MDLARRIASLGLGARGNANLKVRQPLARALVHLGTTHGFKALSSELTEIVVDELNVKVLEYVGEAGELVSYKLLPNLKLLGPKLGKLVPAVRQALAEAEANDLVAKIKTDENVVLELKEQVVELTPEELLIDTEPAEGLAVAADKVITVGIDIVITDELAAEGMARELVRRIQNMRKDAGFDISDKITVYYQTEGALHRVFRAWADYIKAECLALSIEHQLIPEAAFQRKEKVDSLDVMLGVKRVA